MPGIRTPIKPKVAGSGKSVVAGLPTTFVPLRNSVADPVSVPWTLNAQESPVKLPVVSIVRVINKAGAADGKVRVCVVSAV